MSAAALFLILVGPFFGVLCAWVWAVWPAEYVDETRYQAHEDRRRG